MDIFVDIDGKMWFIDNSPPHNHISTLVYHQTSHLSFASTWNQTSAVTMVTRNNLNSIIQIQTWVTFGHESSSIKFAMNLVDKPDVPNFTHTLVTVLFQIYGVKFFKFTYVSFQIDVGMTRHTRLWRYSLVQKFNRF